MYIGLAGVNILTLVTYGAGQTGVLRIPAPVSCGHTLCASIVNAYSAGKPAPESADQMSKSTDGLMRITPSPRNSATCGMPIIKNVVVGTSAVGISPVALNMLIWSSEAM